MRLLSQAVIRALPASAVAGSVIELAKVPDEVVVALQVSSVSVELAGSNSAMVTARELLKCAPDIVMGTSARADAGTESAAAGVGLGVGDAAGFGLPGRGELEASGEAGEAGEDVLVAATRVTSATGASTRSVLCEWQVPFQQIITRCCPTSRSRGMEIRTVT